jgi:hypothetical protein
MGSNQSAWIVGYILLAFFIYITIKGELPIYAGLLLLSPGGTNPSTTGLPGSNYAGPPGPASAGQPGSPFAGATQNTIIQGAITSLMGA